MRDPATTPNTIDVLAPSLGDAVALSARLAQLPEVDHVLTLASFVPPDQPAKLSLIQDAALLLEPVVNPPRALAAPDDGKLALSLRATVEAFSRAQGNAPPPVDAQVGRMAAALARLAQGDAATRRRAAAAFVPGLVTMLRQLKDALRAEAVTIDTLPPELVRDWVAADGRPRVEVFPRGDANDNATLVRFVAAVSRVAPDATGAPISIQESGRTIVRAFAEAGLWAIAAIVLLLTVTLRHAMSVILTLAPLFLSGVATLAICALAGFALNFENIIALPLLFGIGVAFDIYFTMAWRAGRTRFLESSLTRGILFSALTTGVAFGSLWLSLHPGTSSMGKLLALSLATTLAAVLVFMPALLKTVSFRH
jgi:hopanoid biosynthesis associated RND transporter like protein HpnN